jgi:hypothetical protein
MNCIRLGRMSWRERFFYPLADSGENWLLSLPRAPGAVRATEGLASNVRVACLPSESHYQPDVRTLLCYVYVLCIIN